MSKERRHRIPCWIVARLRPQPSSTSAVNAELVTINPDAVPSIVPSEDPDQLPGHGFGHA